MGHSKFLRQRGGIVTAALLLCSFAVLLELLPAGSFKQLAFDDLSQAAAAFLGSCCALWRAARSRGRTRWSWLLLCFGALSWAIGEMIWSYYEVIQRRDTPFPSLADVGFLLFPIFAIAGMLTRPSRAFSGRGRTRVVLDAALVSVSLFNLTWATTLGEVYRAGADSHLALIVGLAYPITDLFVISVVLLVLIDAQNRSGLIVLAVGMSGLAVADSAFEYLTATGTYSTGSPIDIGWVGCFILLGVAAMLDKSGTTRSGTATDTSSTFYLLLPYLLGAGGISVTLIGVARSNHDLVTLVAGAIGLATLFTRQWLTLLENRALFMNLGKKQEELRYQAFHDALTGLANRALFYDRVHHALELHDRDLRPVSVVFCDLDDFKAVNDSLGHAAGDTLLIAIAERLRALVRSGDTVARLGGDEFAVLVEHEGDAERLATRLMESLANPVFVADRELPVRASVGVAVLGATEVAVDGEELLKRADLAMYAAKRAGKGNSVIYTEALRDPEAENLDLSIALRADIAGGRVKVAYQPIFNASGNIFGYEALARWKYRDEAVPPDVFIPLAERSGLLRKLDLTVIKSAIGAISLLNREPDGPVLSVNIGLRNLADQTLAGEIGAQLTRFGLAPHRLMVEVLEDRSIDDPQILQTLSALRDLGIKLALDDFGAGYSSLSRMSALNPDVVKLDRSFLTPVADEPALRELLAGIIDLSHRAGATIVAEGIETAFQLNLLTELGCDGFQGFLLARPAETLLTQTHQRAAMPAATG